MEIKDHVFNSIIVDDELLSKKEMQALNSDISNIETLAIICNAP